MSYIYFSTVNIFRKMSLSLLLFYNRSLYFVPVCLFYIGTEKKKLRSNIFCCWSNLGRCAANCKLIPGAVIASVACSVVSKVEDLTLGSMSTYK